MNNPFKTKNDNKPDPKERKRVFGIAILVLIWGLVAVAALGITAIIFSVQYGKQEDVFTSVKDILAIILPVISVWVGTVLAYYFSKENFESAADKSREMFKDFSSSKEKLKSILAKDAMIKIKDSTYYILEKKPKEVKLKMDLVENILNKNNRNRLPILEKSMVAKYIIHRSIIDKFMVESFSSSPPSKPEDLTLQDMLDKDNFRIMIRDSFRAIKETSTLLDAKENIDVIPNCLDVFVTENGQLDSPVIGWITNAIVAKESTI